MTNEILNINIHEIQVVPGNIVFTEYESLKQQALELAHNIEQVEVTDDNIQVSKKMLAAVNKRIKEMEERRISIKKEILEPYNLFESQVKEIVSIVKDAENLVRDQVRELEENERNEKRAAIREIFEKRIPHYNFGETFGFDDFIKPQHLNKTVTMKAIESEMVNWLEGKDRDLQVIKTLPNADYVLAEYLDTKDLAIAIQIVNQREERRQQVSAPVITKPKEAAFIITLTDEKDATAVEMFMQLKNIKYSMEKVEK